MNLHPYQRRVFALFCALTLCLMCSVTAQATSWLCILSAIPFALLGFVRYNGMNAEQLAVAWVQSELLLPERFLYKGENLYYHIVMEEEH